MRPKRRCLIESTTAEMVLMMPPTLTRCISSYCARIMLLKVTAVKNRRIVYQDVHRAEFGRYKPKHPLYLLRVGDVTLRESIAVPPDFPISSASDSAASLRCA